MNFVKRNITVPDSVTIGAEQAALKPARKWAITYNSVEPIAIVCDALIIMAASLLSGVAYNLRVTGFTGEIAQYVAGAAIVGALFMSRAKIHDLYSPAELLNFKEQARRVSVIWIGVILFLASVVFALKMGDEFSRGATLLFAIGALVALIAMRFFWRFVLAYGLAKSKFSGRRIVLITEAGSADQGSFIGLLARHGFELKRHFLLPVADLETNHREELIAQAVAYVRGSDTQEIVVGADLDRWPELRRLLAGLRILPLPINFVPVGETADLLRQPSRSIGDYAAIELQRGPLTAIERSFKRLFDVACAAIALIVLLPLLLMTAALIKIDSAGPVLFRQKRCGFNGRVFQILKFRTMTVLEDGDAIKQASRNDVRITRVGKWLRRTSIDELPQLFNVLSGSMSIVGPRPHAMAHDNQFDKLVRNYALRHHVKPGLTGWAQVNGFRGETPTVADMEKRVKLDLAYIDNWSLAFDFRIILLTVVEIVRGNNAY
jgi:putative colanic acid biosynthesis UDP-glucose lipid carrier transferase